MCVISLWLVIAGAAFSVAANLRRARMMRNRYGAAFHVLLALGSGYLGVIYVLVLTERLPFDTFGAIYIRPALIILLFLSGGAAFAYPNGQK